MYSTLCWKSLRREGNAATALYIKGSGEHSVKSARKYSWQRWRCIFSCRIWSHSSCKAGLVVSCWQDTVSGPQQQVDSSSALHGFLHRLPIPCHFLLHTFQSRCVSFHLQLHLLSTWLYPPFLPATLFLIVKCQLSTCLAKNCPSASHGS